MEEKKKKILDEFTPYFKQLETVSLIYNPETSELAGITPEDLKEWKDDKEKEKVDNFRKILGTIYEEIIEVLKSYCDLREEYYSLIALWIIGTYLHDQFVTFPYLFINAMKGSGKTRLLKLIAILSKNGMLVGSLKESVLFRTAKGRTLCIDEFESVASKENQSLRELLNACYKKGLKVQRMKKVREDFVVEEFEPYTPICMANIYGMEEVLADRSITMILERSSDDRIMRTLESFDENLMIKHIKSSLELISGVVCCYFSVKGYIYGWNNYLNLRYNYITTHTTQTTLTTHTTLKDIEDLEFFNKIHDTNLNGRDLELMFPLILIAKFLDNETLEIMFNLAKSVTKTKKEDDMFDSRDVSFYDFISNLGIDCLDFIPIKELTFRFRSYLGDEENKEEWWINPKWVGRALKRLALIKDKKRTNKGAEVKINIEKAKEKIRQFKK